LVIYEVKGKTNMKTMLGKKNFGIVGFSYEVTNQTSTKPRIVKRELGRKSS
jgi:hypothetical protein